MEGNDYVLSKSKPKVISHEILEALDELKKIPSSPDSDRDYMETKAKENATREANEKYESGEITRTDT